MEEDWGDIFNGLQEIDSEQEIQETETDVGEDTEYFVDQMLKKETKITIAGLDNTVSSRIIRHAWLLEARHIAIDNIVRTGGKFAFRKITAYTAVIYVDRFFSIMPVQSERIWIAKLLSTACLHLAADKWEDFEVYLPEYAEFTNLDTRTIINMKEFVVKEFGGTKTCVTPIRFVKYFISKFCKDDSRIEYAKIKTVEVIMSTLGGNYY
ncbi:cyclin-D5-3-like [Lycium barbarum]|uniref:cyclin-D5-3-like n=1 Tax=Lycium barbarum TaxID=112863 RepID=UPI00293E0421|nr:cyclin-D5-3-like [Lycium barbarum]